MIRDKERIIGISKTYHVKIIKTMHLYGCQSVKITASGKCESDLIRLIGDEKLNSVLQSMGFSQKRSMIRQTAFSFASVLFCTRFYQDITECKRTDKAASTLSFLYKVLRQARSDGIQSRTTVLKRDESKYVHVVPKHERWSCSAGAGA